MKFFVAQIAIGLGYLHSKQIVYRDLKLENILIGDDGYLLISDFGISKKIDKEGEQTYTQCGTLEYMAPEMLKAKGAKSGYDFAADWWALGTLIYELLVGKPPFYLED